MSPGTQDHLFRLLCVAWLALSLSECSTAQQICPEGQELVEGRCEDVGGPCANMDCSDGNDCTQDLCETDTGTCSNPAEADGTTCDFGGLSGVCSMGTCLEGGPCAGVDCSDGDECTQDLCSPADGSCSNPPVADGTPCGTNGTCVAQICEPTTRCETSNIVISSNTNCSSGGNVLYLNGDPTDFIHPGPDTIVNATWTPQLLAALPETASVRVVPSDPGQGSSWSLEFSSEQLGEPLDCRVYTGAERSAFASPGSPGMSVTGDGRGCNVLCGDFQIYALEIVGDQLKRLGATFEQDCECETATLQGCIFYEAQ